VKFQTSLVGRSEEMAFLQQVLKEVIKRQRGEMVFLTAEPGVGKSRLVSEFIHQNQEGAAIISSAERLTIQPRESYWVFLDLLRDSLNVNEATPDEETRQRLEEKARSVLGEQAQEILPYLLHLLSLPLIDPAVQRRIVFLDPDRLRQKLMLAVLDYLAGLARQQPLILILEDLLEADEPSLDLLVSLLDLLPEMPVLIIAISRPFLHGPLRNVRDAAETRLGPYCQTLYLAHLNQAESLVLLEQILAANGLSAPMKERIVERSQGVPYYLEEIVRLLVETSILRRVGGQWQMKDTAELEAIQIPETLLGLVCNRFNRLDSTSQRVLQASAVIGKRFHQKILQYVLEPMEETQVTQALTRLAKRGFLRWRDDPPAQVGEFTHNLAAEIVYTTLASDSKAHLHGRVGQALEAFLAGQIDSRLELLARHFGWSDQKEPALKYLALAGQKAARSHLNAQARNHFGEALGLLDQVNPEPAIALGVYAGLGDVQFLVGEYVNARGHFESALGIVSSETSNMKFLGWVCSLHRKIGATYERMGEYDQALNYLNQAKNLVEDRSRPFPEEEAQVLNDMGWIHFRLGDFINAEQELIHALSLAQQAGRYDITASIYNRLGGIYWQRYDLNKATNFVQKSLALRQEIGDTVAVARSYNNLGLLDWKHGKWESALHNFEFCLEMHANLGDIEGIIDVHGNLGLLQLDRGNLEAAEDHLKESLRKARQIGHSYIIAMTLMYFSRLCITQEAWQAALDYARQSQQIFVEIGARDELVDVYTLSAMAYLGLGSLKEARLWAQNTADLLPKDKAGALSVHTDEGGRALRLLGEVSRLSGEFTRAEKLLDQSVQLFSRMGYILEQARTMMSQARLAADLGDQSQARVVLNEARLMFDQLGAKLDLQKLEILTSQIDSIRGIYKYG
jgi:predicted ATPase